MKSIAGTTQMFLSDTSAEYRLVHSNGSYFLQKLEPNSQWKTLPTVEENNIFPYPSANIGDMMLKRIDTAPRDGSCVKLANKSERISGYGYYDKELKLWQWPHPIQPTEWDIIR